MMCVNKLKVFNVGKEVSAIVFSLLLPASR